VEIAGAADGKGKATMTEAESTYTVANGYFGSMGYSSCEKQ
jgi:hypothetical protein